MRQIFGLMVVGGLVVAACRGEPRREGNGDFAGLVDSLKPAIERAARLRFREPVQAAMRSRQQLRAYLVERIESDFPPERLRGTELSYRLLGLLPDTLQLERFLVDLLTEQVAGFYDPRTRTLYGMEGSDPAALRLIMAHELVHALQHQYLPLDSIMRPDDDDDRQLAAHAVLEGQATLASLKALMPDGAAIPPEIWTQARDQIAGAQAASPRFAAAPLAIREQLLFPYLEGADFMLWWESSPWWDTVPYGPRMPVSSEQIILPDQYPEDQPRALRFQGSDDALFENTMGDLGLRILTAQLSGSREIASALDLGWDGDRYRVYETGPAGALVWDILWESEAAADRFDRNTVSQFNQLARPGYRTAITRAVFDGSPITRIVIGPEGWEPGGGFPSLSVRPSSPPSSGDGSGAPR